MAVSSLFYYNDQLGKVVPNELVLQFKITGAKASSPIVANTAALTAYDAIASQSVIDSFLATSSVAEGLTASTLACEGALGASGNVAGRFVVSGLDALTSGMIEVRFCWIAK